MSRQTVGAVVLFCVLQTLSFAVPTNIVDTTAGTATLDGTVNAAEYVGFGVGINGGFGDVWGAGAQLHIDSDTAGNINLGFVRGPGGFFDRAVIYIDSVGGGFADTTTLEDTGPGDSLRRAISGDNPGGDSELTFGAGFVPDFAIGWESGFAGLFALVAGGDGSLAFVTSLGSVNAGTHWEGAFNVADIGINSGDSFRYLAVYLNPNDAAGPFRSDEVMGATLPPGNPGGADVTLPDAQFNTFTTIVPEPSTLAFLGIGAIGFAARLLRRKHA